MPSCGNHVLHECKIVQVQGSVKPPIRLEDGSQAAHTIQKFPELLVAYRGIHAQI